MKKYEVVVEWKIEQREKHFFTTGETAFIIFAQNQVEAINKAIHLCKIVPSSEFERNGIDIEHYENNYFTDIYKIKNICLLKEIKIKGE